MEFIRVFGNSLKSYIKVFVKNNNVLESLMEATKLIKMWDE